MFLKYPANEPNLYAPDPWQDDRGSRTNESYRSIFRVRASGSFFPVQRPSTAHIVPNPSSVLTAMSLVLIELSVAFIVDINFDRSAYTCAHRTRRTLYDRSVVVTTAVGSLHEYKLKVFNKTEIHSTRISNVFSNEDRRLKPQKESDGYFE